MAKIPPGWQPIVDAPRDGSWVRVGHTLDTASLRTETICPVHGRFVGGEWVCDAGFTCEDMLFRWLPDVWLPGTSS